MDVCSETVVPVALPLGRDRRSFPATSEGGAHRWAAMVAVSLILGGCVAHRPDRCRRQSDCDAGEFCRASGFCDRECRGDRDCPCGSLCDASCGLCLRADGIPATCYAREAGLSDPEVMGACRGPGVTDSGLPAPDGSTASDGGETADAGPASDAGVLDAGALDTGTPSDGGGGHGTGACGRTPAVLPMCVVGDGGAAAETDAGSSAVDAGAADGSAMAPDGGVAADAGTSADGAVGDGGAAPGDGDAASGDGG